MPQRTQNKKGSKLPLFLLIGAFLLVGGSSARAMIAPVRGRIISKFGEEREKGTHMGIDIAVPVGTPIQAPAAGKVIDVYKKPAGGNQVLIKHTNGYTTGYAHLKAAIVKKGASVSKGEIIGLSGNTGTSTTGPHLHFTLRDPKGRYVDPSRYFKFR